MLEPDAGTVTRLGTLGVAEQEMHIGRTVGDIVEIELAVARAALAALDVGVARRSATTAPCLRTWPPRSSTWTRAATAGRACSAAGGLAGYQDGRRAERERWTAEYDQQRAEHARLTQDLSEGQNRLVGGWRPDKGTGKHQRATRAPALVRSVHRRRDGLAEHAVDMPPPPLRFRMPELPARPGGTLLSAEEVTVAGRLDQPVTVALESGARLVVTGANWAGTSTLLSVLAGRIEPTGGRVRTARTARVRCWAHAMTAQSSAHSTAETAGTSG